MIYIEERDGGDISSKSSIQLQENRSALSKEEAHPQGI